EALSVYERCKRTLAAVLWITPSPETEALLTTILGK
ncbi:MAG: bacterial transcriptional activator domain-containing protein, partial [Deltaproteobacteria bacterium]|nr:bacterial transcriptional activator domain-containing protein [Deltaproteobacteria bacterium]